MRPDPAAFAQGEFGYAAAVGVVLFVIVFGISIIQLRLLRDRSVYPGPILVYAALGIPFGTYLMTTYFRGVPTELVEASLMDGASYRQIFTSVMVPLAIPAIVTVAVLQFIQIWGDLLIGLLFLNQPDVRTITVGLATLRSARIIPVPMIMAGRRRSIRRCP